MIAMIERLAVDFRKFAPELSASPKTSLFRIYRDTRFSDDKTPLKTHVSASFPHRALGKGRGAGMYLEVTPTWVWVGGGMYHAETAELHAVREHIAANHRRLRKIVTSPGFRRAVGELQGEQLQRVPRGFPTDHPAAGYFATPPVDRRRRIPAGLRHQPSFYSGVLKIFRGVAPLVDFLNEPLTRSIHN